MSSSIIIIIAKGIIILGSLLSIIYTAGIVWRVEKKLDLSYKLILTAIISFAFSEIILLFDFSRNQLSLIISICLRVSFVIFFLAGILEARNMLRKMDGEK